MMKFSMILNIKCNFSLGILSVLLPNKNGILIGIKNTAANCSQEREETFPTVYARISNAVPWIRSIIKQGDPHLAPIGSNLFNYNVCLHHLIYDNISQTTYLKM